MDFQDTHMTEPEHEQYFDTGDKILKLNDELSEDIILENIVEQLGGKLSDYADKINYVSLYREKYSSITPDLDYYDKDYMTKSLSRLVDLLDKGLTERFGVTLGEDLDSSIPSEYLKDMETLYEFLYIRQFQNLVDYIEFKLEQEREKFIQKYSSLMVTEEHAKDLFVIQAKKKFKNDDDILIMHFMNDIINDICEETESAYVLFDTIANIDLFEEFNNRMSELLINYGNKIVITNDSEAAKKYLEPFFDVVSKGTLRNKIWADYLEKCEVSDE